MQPRELLKRLVDFVARRQNSPSTEPVSVESASPFDTPSPFETEDATTEVIVRVPLEPSPLKLVIDEATRLSRRMTSLYASANTPPYDRDEEGGTIYGEFEFTPAENAAYEKLDKLAGEAEAEYWQYLRDNPELEQVSRHWAREFDTLRLIDAQDASHERAAAEYRSSKESVGPDPF